MSAAMPAVDLTPFLPELILAGGVLALMILNLVVRENRGLWTAVGGGVVLGIAAVATLLSDESAGGYLFDSVVQDGITVFFRVFFVAATLLSMTLMLFTFRRDGEPFLLVLCSVLGMFLLAGSNDLVTLFVAFELVSIPSYVLAGYKRHDVRSAEASLKYVLYGAMSSGVLLYGFSLLYGLTGTTSLSAIAALNAATASQQTAWLIALTLILAGIGYKIAMVPLHFWCPDVYDGSPTAITAFFSVLPKAAGFAALYRLLHVFDPLHTAYGIDAGWLFTAASALTMTFGNLGAIWQTGLKRLLAYSSIAHAGYVLMGFAVLVEVHQSDVMQTAVIGILFYLIAYLFMNLGAFFVVDLVERRLGGETINHFRGLGKAMPLTAIIFVVFLFSLTGIPPLAGFVGKFLLFAALVKGKLWTLAIIAALNTVVSLYYYVKIVREMFLFDPLPEYAEVPVEQPQPLGGLTGLLSAATVFPTLILGLWWGPLAEWIRLRTW